jgi:pimeloyl-ACP methyl ester carboxylesterase
MYIATVHQRMMHGGESFGTAAYRPLDAPEVSAPLATVVMAPGWVGGRQTCADLAQGIAATSGGRLEVVTYDEPLVGAGAYSRLYRAERFTHVVRQLASQRPLMALGHSRGWLTVLDSAEAWQDGPQVQALVGLTPLGGNLLPGREAALGVGAEIVSSPFNSAPLVRDRIKITGQLAGRGLVHGLANPRAACKQIRETLRSNELAKTVELSRKLPTLLVSGTRDGVVPPILLRQRLRELGYEGRHLHLPVTHVGALAYRGHMARLSSALSEFMSPFGQERKARPGQLAK